MSRIKVVVLCSMMFVAGAAIGGYAAFRATSEILGTMMADFGAISAGTGVATHVAVLERLRKGDTAEAIESLETLLDGNILELAGAGQTQLNARAMSTMRRAEVYRNRYPHATTNPTVDTAVAAALGKGK